MARCLPVLLLAALLAACGGSSSDDSGADAGAQPGPDAAAAQPAADASAAQPGADAGPVSGPDASSSGPDAETPIPADGGETGEPIVATPGTWTWVDFPDSACDDGTPTGIGVNLSSTSDDVAFFFNGGGACWSYQTCFQLKTAAQGPYGATEFAAAAPGLSASGTLFDRNDATNPLRDFNYVFVPYCTGDLHAGDNVTTYSNGSDSKTYHHVGHANLQAYLRRLVPTLPAPGKLVVAGSSAGGYGATLNYDTLRGRWASAQGYLIDDSGPFFEGDAISASQRSQWYSAWNMGALLDPLCADCRNDLSALDVTLFARYPSDRMALLSSLQDQTIRSYLMMSATTFQTALTTLAADVYDPTSNARYFFVSGQTHTMLGSMSGFSSNGTPLPTWLGAMLTDDTTWASLKP